MRITPAVAVAAVAFVSGGAGALGAAWFEGAAASQPATVALVTPGFSGTKPSAIQFSVDGRDAVGRDNCQPNCAEGRTSYVPATITLSAPDTHGEWTVVSETIQGRTT